MVFRWYECSHRRRLVVRTARHLLSDADSKAAEFGKCFQELRKAIVGRTVLNLERLVWRIGKDVQLLGMCLIPPQ